MNVYMLTAEFTPETVRAPAVVQQQFEDAFRKVLKGSALVEEFSRVSVPDKATGKMAVVCSEEVAQLLRTKSDELAIESLVLDEGRTERRRMAYAHS